MQPPPAVESSRIPTNWFRQQWKEMSEVVLWNSVLKIIDNTSWIVYPDRPFFLNCCLSWCMCSCLSSCSSGVDCSGGLINWIDKLNGVSRPFLRNYCPCWCTCSCLTGCSSGVGSSGRLINWSRGWWGLVAKWQVTLSVVYGVSRRALSCGSLWNHIATSRC